jgi:hypothetical protein
VLRLRVDISKVNHQITIDFHRDEARQLEGFNMLYCWCCYYNTTQYCRQKCWTSGSFLFLHSAEFAPQKNR